jgi:hypothetical protein
MPVTTQDVNPEDTLEVGRQKLNGNDEGLATHSNTLETQAAAHVGAGHPSLYYSKSEVDAAIAASTGGQLGYQEFVGWVQQVGTSAPAVTVFHNDFAVTPTTQYVLLGRYLLTLEGMLTPGKTFIMIGANGRPAVAFGQAYNNDGHSVLISTFDFNENWVDGVLTAPIIVRVYE